MLPFSNYCWDKGPLRKLRTSEVSRNCGWISEKIGWMWYKKFFCKVTSTLTMLSQKVLRLFHGSWGFSIKNSQMFVGRRNGTHRFL